MPSDLNKSLGLLPGLVSSLDRQPALFASPLVAVVVGVLWREFVTSLAMRGFGLHLIVRKNAFNLVWRSSSLGVNDIGIGKPLSHSRRDGICLQTAFLGQFDKKMRSAFDRYADNVRLVTSLLFVGGPSAILRGVGAVPINAVDGVTGRRTFAHVGLEILKDQPALANCDALPSVPLPRGMIGVCASAAHTTPQPV